MEYQLLVDSVFDQSTASNEFPALQDHQAAAIERPARPHCSRQPDLDLVITATLEGHMARHRPLLVPTYVWPTTRLR